MLFLTSVPRVSRNTSQTQTGTGDLRRVSYQLVTGTGLVRQECHTPRADGTWEEEPPVVLAAEVVGLTFRYFDSVSSQWSSTWDGTTSGPPQAVEITMSIIPPTETAMGGVQKPATTYRTVVAIPTAAIPQELVDGQNGAQP